MPMPPLEPPDTTGPTNPLVPDLLPARMVNEFVYCPRLAYLEWVQGEWDDNADTVGGRYAHRRVDVESSAEIPSGDAVGDTRLTTRSVLLSSESLGAIARMDLLEIAGGRVTPVDYKRGPVPPTQESAWEPERVQLCVQGLILRDNGYQCDGGVLYFAESRTRIEVAFDAALEATARAAIAGLRAMATRTTPPPPLVSSPKCVRCSLVGICLPDEVNRLTHPELEEEPRRLLPARDEALPLYIQEQGALVSRKDERLVITLDGDTLREVRLLDVSHAVLFGRVQITTPVVQALCEREIPITYLSQGAWFYGMTTGLAHKNVELRIAQHRAAESDVALSIARSLVSGKIQNQRTILRRNLDQRDPKLLGRLALHARQARHTGQTATLLGIEGIAAQLYFSAFHRLFRGAGAWAGEVFREHGRNRRPPGDEVNAVLSFLYAVLTKECAVIAQAVGFEVYRGMYHTPKYGRPAMALDLCEEFRPLIADSICLNLFNQGEVAARDFVRRARGVALTPKGRRAVLAAFERRMGQMVTHPVFGYTISYRRVVELQARLLRAVILGEVPGYRPFTTR